jgi:hypothetical protein
MEHWLPRRVTSGFAWFADGCGFIFIQVVLALGWRENFPVWVPHIVLFHETPLQSHTQTFQDIDFRLWQMSFILYLILNSLLQVAHERCLWLRKYKWMIFWQLERLRENQPRALAIVNFSRLFLFTILRNFKLIALGRRNFLRLSLLSLLLLRQIQLLVRFAAAWAEDAVRACQPLVVEFQWWHIGH